MKFFLPGGLIVDRDEKPTVKPDPSPFEKPAVEEPPAAEEEVKPKAKRRGRPRKSSVDAE